MADGHAIPLSRLLARLSPILLHGREDLLRVEDPVSTFVLYDPSDATPVPEGALVLGIGVTTDEDIRRIVRISSGATALVLRESVVQDPELLTERGSPVHVLTLHDEATWSQLAATLAVVFGLAQETAESATFGDAETDLFTLANSVASLVGGPVTIEDLSFRILAFSADQAEADYARTQSVLGHQVPEAYSASLREQGLVRTIYQSPTPVLVGSIAPGVRPRVVMRLQAGGELLGSVWIVADEPLSAQRQQGLIEAANVIALTMLRIRMTQDSTARMRTERVLSLLDGGSRALEAARSARLPLVNLAVLALGLPLGDDGSDAEFEMQRLTSALAMHLHSVRSNLPVALLGDVVYAVLPLESDADARRALAIAEDFLSRAAGTRTLLIGVGSPVEVRGLPASRQEADRVLRVLRHRAREGSEAAIAEDVFIDSLLLRMSDLVDDSADTITGPLRILSEYDAEHDTQLVETLRAWLDNFGDVATAAEKLLIHKNTFRYRLRRLSELADIDVDDPEQRFGLMLQLRLFPL